MADTTGEGASIFRQSAMSRINSADDLDRYIKVTNPSIWMILGAIVALLIGFTIWSATAIIPTNIMTTGVAVADEVTVWVDEATYADIEKTGEKNILVTINGEHCKVKGISSVPLSANEIKAELGSEYLQQALKLSDWNYEILIESPTKSQEIIKLVPVKLTVSETHPISFLAN